MASNYIGYSMSSADVKMILKGDKSHHIFKSRDMIKKAQNGMRFYVKEALVWSDDQSAIVYAADGIPVPVPEDYGVDYISERCPAGFMPKWARRFDMIVQSVETNEIDGDTRALLKVRFERVVSG